MKLKKAVKKARKLGYKWVAVNDLGDIFLFNYKPVKTLSRTQWLIDISECDNPTNMYIGRYTGSKNWTKTLREVI